MFIVGPKVQTELMWWSGLARTGQTIALSKEINGELVEHVLVRCRTEKKAISLFRDINEASGQRRKKFNITNWSKLYEAGELNSTAEV